MIDDEEILIFLREIGGMVGFASNEMAWAYLGCMLISLLCVYYGLIQWIRDWVHHKRGKWKKKSKHPRRRR
jgi:hypothetical protein